MTLLRALPSPASLRELRTAAAASAHCLAGCAIGEILGLAIGVSLGLGAGRTIALAVVLAFISGLTLACGSVVRREGLGWRAAFKGLWLGEVVSISVMELAMNFVDWQLGGASAHSLADPIFWLAIAAALPAGFIAVLPVNAWLLRKQIKKACHGGHGDHEGHDNHEGH